LPAGDQGERRGEEEKMIIEISARETGGRTMKLNLLRRAYEAGVFHIAGGVVLLLVAMAAIIITIATFAP